MTLLPSGVSVTPVSGAGSATPQTTCAVGRLVDVGAADVMVKLAEVVGEAVGGAC